MLWLETAPGTCFTQISLPVSASSATTRFPAGTYITPPTTIGVAAALIPAAPPPPLPLPFPPPFPLSAFAAGGGAAGRYVHTCVSFDAFAVVICFNGENRELVRSREYIGQSPAGTPPTTAALAEALA